MGTIKQNFLDGIKGADIVPDDSNDPEFLERIADIIQGTVQVHHPRNVNFIRIDNWFSRRWLGFSGKVLGALGCWRKDLVIPPFVPNRVESISTYHWDDELKKYLAADFIPELHIKQPSSENFQKKLKNRWPDNSFFWYSANTKKNGRGSLMAYVSGPEGHWPWYLGFQKTDDWKIKEIKGISLHQVQTFQETCLEKPEVFEENLK